MQIGGRSLGKIAGAMFQQRHYVAAGKMLRVYNRPVDALKRYLFKLGKYPHPVCVNTPMGQIHVYVYSHHDILTTNEIFCREDYKADEGDRVVVDFGSNIGISAAYFLTRSSQSRVYLFEPLKLNIDRLRKNLRPFEGRYTLYEAAVGLAEGEVDFGWEDSGRYGGVGMRTGNSVSVKCVDSNKVLEQILYKHGRINILKIDIETLEWDVTARIPVEHAKKIDKIYVEYKFNSNPLHHTHQLNMYGGIAQFINKHPTDL